jgi:hypothetical protein
MLNARINPLLGDTIEGTLDGVKWRSDRQWRKIAAGLKSAQAACSDDRGKDSLAQKIAEVTKLLELIEARYGKR